MRAALPDGRTLAAPAHQPVGLSLAAGLSLRSRRSCFRAARRITMRYTYDNSDDNDGESASPAASRHLGTAVERRDGQPWSSDGAALSARKDDAGQLLRRSERSSTTCAEQRVRVRQAPDDAHERTWLGSSYLEAGRIAEAIEHLQIAVRLDPRSAQAHNFLGGALLDGWPDRGSRLHTYGRRRHSHQETHTCSSTSAKRSRPPVAPRTPPPRFARAIAIDGCVCRGSSGTRRAALLPWSRSERRSRICNARSISRPNPRKRTATLAVRSPKPDDSIRRHCTCDARWS